MSKADENKYRLLVESVADYSICYLQPNGEISSWNAGAQRFYGLPEAEAVGRNFGQFYTDEDRAAGLPELALETAIREGRYESFGWRLRNDGTRFWAHAVIDPIRDGDGRLLGFAKITRDLTERRQADEALRRSEEQFRLLVQGVRDYAIYMLDPEGHVISWNAGAERIKGYREEEVLGHHFGNFYADEDVRAGYPARNLEIARRNGVFEGEGWRVRKDGSRFWAHVVIDRLTDADGKVVGFAKITRDVTEKRLAERELANAREALLQSQKAEAIGQLTGGVAHDFNNLLMAVMSNLELLQKWLPQEPRPRALLANAMAGARRGASLTQRMLAFARRQELHPRPVDVPVLVHGMANLLQSSIGPQTRIDASFPLHLPRVLIDANQLELVVMNLVVNGRDAMPHGGNVRIGAREERIDAEHATGLPAGDYVCLWVTDEGQGMDEETLARATEPFFTTKGVGKGTGLGLSMAHGLAEQSGGRLMLHSQLGKGTTVELWLPVAPVQPERPAVPSAPEVPTPSAGASRMVLVVDDDELVLESTMAMAEDLGCIVHGARSGSEALAFIEHHDEVELVITDQAMPGMTGAELATRLRKTRPELPVVLASGYAELPEPGMPGVVRLSKPFAKRELDRAIADAMAESAGTTG